MAFVSPTEFAKYCGLDSSIKANKDKVYNWIKRNNVVCTVVKGEKVIDTENEKNKEWASRQKKLSILNKERGVSSIQAAEEHAIIKKTKKKIAEMKSEDFDDNSVVVDMDSDNDLELDGAEVMANYGLDKKLKQQQLAKLKEDTEYRSLQVEKIKGKIIPTEVAEACLKAMNHGMVHAMHDRLDRLCMELGQELELDNARVSELRDRMDQAINESMDNSIIIAKKMLEASISEMTEKR